LRGVAERTRFQLAKEVVQELERRCLPDHGRNLHRVRHGLELWDEKPPGSPSTGKNTSAIGGATKLGKEESALKHETGRTPREDLKRGILTGGFREKRKKLLRSSEKNRAVQKINLINQDQTSNKGIQVSG